MTLEVIERHVFHITNRAVAKQVRRALAADDIERLDDVIRFLNDPAGHDATSAITSDVLDCER